MKAHTRAKPWKIAFLNWLCIYPLINIIFFTLMPLIGSWPILLRTLLVTVILVPLMGLAMRQMQGLFGNWLLR